MEPIAIPVPGLVVLIGASGSGKTTLAARLFDAAEIVSSDDLRAVVSGDAADQRATRTAFAILHREVGRRLAAGRLVVVDATNVETGARRSLLGLARLTGRPAVALVLAIPAGVVHARNAARAGRVVPADIVDRHLARLAGIGVDPRAVTERLTGEGFARVHVLAGGDTIEVVRVARISPP